MATGWATVPVFISSTFSDMHAERDYLVKRVFPRLREQLEKYRIHLDEIDLRWGVTKEQADDDLALDLCLQQIDYCRPFFIGILGERYGYVPKEIPDLTKPEYGWVQGMTGKSITELEIIHGVLNDHEMQARSFFYFRDKSFLENVPTTKHPEILSDDSDWTLSDGDLPSEKLAKLKQTILAAEVPVFENYPCDYSGLKINWRLARQRTTWKKLTGVDQKKLEHVASDNIVDPQEYVSLNDELREFVNDVSVVYLNGLKQFGEEVFKQLEHAILNPVSDSKLAKHLHTVQQPQEDKLGLAEEADYHERFMASRLRVYVGREPIQRELMAFAESDHAVPCLVTGPSGLGKSAAMANFVREYEKEHNDENVLLIPHFIGASPSSTSLRLMLRRFCLELQRVFGFDEEIPQETNQLSTTFRDFIERVPDDQRVIFVIDALNQLDTTDNAQALNWLPRKLPAHIKIVTSCIDDPDHDEAALQTFQHREKQELKIEPLRDEERIKIIKKVPSLSAKTLDSLQVSLLLTNPATSNPLFLLVALEELRGFGSFEELDTRITTFPRPRENGEPAWKGLLADSRADAIGESDEKKRRERLERLERIEESLKQVSAIENTVTAIFTQVIQRLEVEFDPVVVRSILELLAIARYGLSRAELLAVIEGEQVATDESTSDFFPVLSQLRVYLQPRGEVIDFFHRGLYKSVREKYLSSDLDQVAAHRRLADYFHRQLNPIDADPWSGDNQHAISELPYHQTEGEYWDELETTLTSIRFMEAKNQAGRVFDLVGDLARAIKQIPDEIIWAGPIKHEQRQQRPSEGYTTKKLLRLLEEALRSDIHFIARHAEDYPQGLFQCLWNSCWWYDCPEASQHYEEPEGGWNIQNAPWLHFKLNRLHSFLERLRKEREQAVGGFHWLRSNRPPPVHLGTAQLAVLRGHSRDVSSVSYSPNGQLIASGSDDHTVRLWDAAGGAELTVLRGHRDAVTSVSFSPDGRRIASGSWDNTVRVWDAMSGAELVVLRGAERSVLDVAFSPDGQQVAGCCLDNTIRAWATKNGAELTVFRGHESRVTSMSYSPDGQLIASGSDDHTVRLWDAQSGDERAVLHGHEGEVYSVAFSTNGKQIASGSGDGTVRTWDAQSGAELTVFRGHEQWITSVSYSPDGRRIASGSLDRTVRVWDAQRGVELAVLRGHGYSILGIAFSPDGRRIASVSKDKTVRIWDAGGGDELAALLGHKAWVHTASFSSDGRLIASSSSDKTGCEWDAATGVCLETFHNVGDLFPDVASFVGDPRRTLPLDQETVFTVANVTAWFPVSFRKMMVSDPNERTWAGSVGSHLYIITLEGTEETTEPEL